MVHIMATTTSRETPGPQAVSTPPKRAHVATGQPKGGLRDPVGGRPAAPPKPSPSPAVIEESSFWEWLENLPKNSWGQNLLAYVWRCGPLIDTGNGKPTSIAKLSEPFDLKFMLENFGSGYYRFDVCETPPSPATKGKCLRRSYEMVLDMRYPPKIPMGTWIDDTRNANWEWCRGDLEAEAERRSAASQPQQSNGIIDTLELFTKLQEISGGKADSSMTAVVLQMLQSNQEALRNYQDPAKQFTTLKSLMDMAGGGKQQDSGMGMVLEIMRDELRATRAELAALRAQPPVNPVAQLKETLGVLQDLGMNMPGSGGGKANGNSITEAVIDVAGKVIDKLADVAPSAIAAYQFGKQKEAEIEQIKANAPKNRPWEFGADKTPAVAGPVASPNPAPPAAAAPPMEQVPMTAQRLFTKYAALIQSIGPILIDHFQGSDGIAFQDWFLDRKGREVFNAFRADATPELLTEAVTAHPNLKLIFQPEEKVLQFFSDLLSDPDDEEEQDDDENGGTLAEESHV